MTSLSNTDQDVWTASEWLNSYSDALTCLKLTATATDAQIETAAQAVHDEVKSHGAVITGNVKEEISKIVAKAKSEAWMASDWLLSNHDYTAKEALLHVDLTPNSSHEDVLDAVERESAYASRRGAVILDSIEETILSWQRTAQEMPDFRVHMKKHS